MGRENERKVESLQSQAAMSDSRTLTYDEKMTRSRCKKEKALDLGQGKSPRSRERLYGMVLTYGIP